LSGKPLILILLVLLTGCSALKSGKTNSENVSPRYLDLQKIIARNLSANDFYIKKAEVRIDIGNKKQTLLASVKYKETGSWLISLKSNIGIEVARVYITADTLLINYRLEKKLYYGKTNIIEKKYGIPFKAIPIIFGDFIEENFIDIDSIRCAGAKNAMNIKFDKVNLEYFISCRDSKIVSSNLKNQENKVIQFAYSKIRLSDSKKYPSRIKIIDNADKCIIEIRIRNIYFGSIESLNFIPGRGYENILLK
jgi:hypothetical protein